MYQKKLMNHTKLIRCLTIFSVSVVLLLSSCSQKAFEKAVATNTVEAYNNFLTAHYETKYAAKAKALKKKLENSNTSGNRNTRENRGKNNDNLNKKELIVKAEKKALSAGKKILAQGRKMVFKYKTIIKGSCWNYVNEVYNRSGYPNSKRQIIFKSKKRGPYVNLNKIQAGDWLYYINHSYNGVEHSGIFVYWVDYRRKIGMILSYAGGGRKEVGRYLSYDLKNVYYITRGN